LKREQSALRKLEKAYRIIPFGEELFARCSDSFEIVEAFIGYGDFLHAKFIVEDFLPMTKNDTVPHCEVLRGRAEFGLCNYSAAIHHFKLQFAKEITWSATRECEYLLCN